MAPSDAQKTVRKALAAFRQFGAVPKVLHVLSHLNVTWLGLVAGWVGGSCVATAVVATAVVASDVVEAFKAVLGEESTEIRDFEAVV